MSFSWGSSNNTNNNNNQSSNSFAWGSSTNNNNNNNQSSNSNNNSLAWGNNTNNNSSNNQNNSTNNNWSFGGNNQGNNTNVNTSREGWNNNTNTGNASFTLNTNNNNNSWSNNNNNSSGGAVNPNNDYVIPNTPNNAISCVRFHPSKAQFIVSSWDNTISYHEFFGNNQCKQVGQQKHDKPALSCCFDPSGGNVFSAGCDNVIKIWNCQQNQFATLGQHGAPIRCVEYNAGANFVISGSWDKTVAFWDTRSVGNNNGKAVHSLNVGHKVYAMATKQNHLVVGLSNNDVISYDLRNGARQLHSLAQESSKNTKAVTLKKQIRCIDIFPDNTGYVAASIGGRVIIKHFDRQNLKHPNGKEKDFSYKCHRQSAGNMASHIFGVNVIKFHQQSSVFATGGDDGDVVTWDKDGRAKLYSFKTMTMGNYRESGAHIDTSRMPIVALDYHANGQYMIYATSYNWNKGAEFNMKQQQKPQIYLHQVNKQELDKTKKK
eukprot:310258_1